MKQFFMNNSFYSLVYILLVCSPHFTLQGMGLPSSSIVINTAITVNSVRAVIEKLAHTDYPVFDSYKMLFNGQAVEVLTHIQTRYTPAKLNEAHTSIDRQCKFRNQLFDAINKTYANIKDASIKQALSPTIFRAALFKLFETKKISSSLHDSFLAFEVQLLERLWFANYTFTTYYALVFDTTSATKTFRKTLLIQLYSLAQKEDIWYSLIEEFSPQIATFEELGQAENLTILLEHVDVIVDKFNKEKISPAAILCFCFPELLEYVTSSDTVITQEGSEYFNRQKVAIIDAIKELLAYYKKYRHFNNTGACRSPHKVRIPKSSITTKTDIEVDGGIFYFEEDSPRLDTRTNYAD